jgi:hypothetical protein
MREKIELRKELLKIRQAKSLGSEQMRYLMTMDAIKLNLLKEIKEFPLQSKSKTTRLEGAIRKCVDMH